MVSRGLRRFLFPRRGEPPREGLGSLVLRNVKMYGCCSFCELLGSISASGEGRENYIVEIV